MAVTGTFTVAEIVTAALRKIGVSAGDETPSSADMASGVEALNWMLKAWQVNEELDLAVTSLSHSLTATAAQTLTPVRPVRILHVNFRQSSIDRPLTEMTRQEYDTLPNKSTAGDPTSWYYDRQKESAVLYIWPVPSSVSGKTLEITYERELEDIAASTDTVDLPVEAHECAVYMLADRLSDDYELDRPKVTARAQYLWGELLAGQNEGSVWFTERDQ